MADALEPRYMRAARALLGWSQADLAQASGVSTSAIADHERGARKPMPNNARAVRAAFETAGIEFIPRGLRWR